MSASSCSEGSSRLVCRWRQTRSTRASRAVVAVLSMAGFWHAPVLRKPVSCTDGPGPETECWQAEGAASWRPLHNRHHDHAPEQQDRSHHRCQRWHWPRQRCASPPKGRSWCSTHGGRSRCRRWSSRFAPPVAKPWRMPLTWLTGHGTSAGRSGPAVLRRLDIALNNAGMLGPGVPAAEFPVDAWREVMATNLDAAFHAARAQLPALLARGGGSLVFVGTFVGHTVDSRAWRPMRRARPG